MGFWAKFILHVSTSFIIEIWSVFFIPSVSFANFIDNWCLLNWEMLLQFTINLNAAYRNLPQFTEAKIAPFRHFKITVKNGIAPENILPIELTNVPIRSRDKEMQMNEFILKKKRGQVCPWRISVYGQHYYRVIKSTAPKEQVLMWKVDRVLRTIMSQEQT